MTTVAGVDHRHGGGAGGHQSGAFLRMADGHHVHIVGHGLQGVGNGLTLGHRGQLRAGEADDLAAETQHCGLEAQTGAGGGLIEQCGEHASVTSVSHFLTMAVNICGLMQNIEDLVC